MVEGLIWGEISEQQELKGRMVAVIQWSLQDYSRWKRLEIQSLVQPSYPHLPHPHPTTCGKQGTS